MRGVYQNGFVDAMCASQTYKDTHKPLKFFIELCFEEKSFIARSYNSIIYVKNVLFEAMMERFPMSLTLNFLNIQSLSEEVYISVNFARKKLFNTGGGNFHS